MSHQIIDLFTGWPSPKLLPASRLLEASQRVLSDPDVAASALQYGPDPGCAALREAIAEWINDFYSAPWTMPSRICISGGASQSLACILQVYTDPTYTKNIFMIAPTYHLACKVFEDNGFAGRLKAVPEDEQGIDIDYLENFLLKGAVTGSCSSKTYLKTLEPSKKFYKYVIYTVPTFSNPSGKTMTAHRRRQLVRLARRHDALVIADDIYDQLQWPQERLRPHVLPRLVDIDHELDGGPARATADGFGNAISNGSFSKILAPGCRTGWVEATEKFIDGLAKCGSTRSGGSASQLTATVIADLLHRGDLTEHINHCLIPALERRYRLMMDAIQRYLEPLGAGVKGMPPSLNQTSGAVCDGGGYFVWIELPYPITSREFAIRARDQAHVLVAEGPLFEVNGDERSMKCDREVRICFTWEDETLLTEGIQRLGNVISDMLGEN
ncbi:pyridoxal phosphate-dependent transferase [Lipomyces kononenkoae]